MAKYPVNWMLSEAIDSLARAERLHRQFFSLQPSAGSQESSWEPPIDVLETDEEILILVALPGVDPDEVEAVIDGDTLIVSGPASDQENFGIISAKLLKQASRSSSSLR